MRKSVGNVLDLFVSKKGEKQRFQRDKIELDESGILEDKFYAKDIMRSVLLTTTQSYQLAASKGINISYGLLGENILIDFNPYALPIGTQMKIGEVLVEITQNCTICNHLSKVDKALPKLLENDRGVFVKVIQPGFIEIGNSVDVL
ncbi:MAG TPA: MOSC domain-containing protein [Campylobacterales bacterium]|nr:MOSC domain-containing protein [Campylobacterales bacterium]HHS91756.1 MOSC domain-containing protein [Campylobacterales bacterium]